MFVWTKILNKKQGIFFGSKHYNYGNRQIQNYFKTLSGLPSLVTIIKCFSIIYFLSFFFVSDFHSLFFVLNLVVFLLSIPFCLSSSFFSLKIISQHIFYWEPIKLILLMQTNFLIDLSISEYQKSLGTMYKIQIRWNFFVLACIFKLRAYYLVHLRDIRNNSGYYKNVQCQQLKW